MTRSIQIYGLPRSGTNYLQFLIRENTHLVQLFKEEKSFYLDKYVVKKHCEPDDSTNYKIFLIKTFNNWKESYSKWDSRKDNNTLKFIYNIATEDYLDWYKQDEKNSIIVFWEDLVGNEKEFLKKLGDKFQCYIANEIKTTSKKMGRNEGKSLMNVDFKYKKPIKLNYNPLKIDFFNELIKFKII